ncbi:DUF6479 family protein [Streptomyces sp. NPDC093225]|uniref:DUF6479 family protein n=1 Tax=Streptomyces sp. NPDC093225 TaxID=3366034 RepID=UPI0038112FD4
MIASLASVPLAASGSPSLWMIAAGVVVVAVLLGAFWYGSRRVRAGKDPGARPGNHTPPAQAREDSWQTPDESTSAADGPHHR